MKILVTGATGFIGSRFVERAVAHGHSIVALVRRRTPALEHPSITAIVGDLGDPATLARAVAGCGGVVHLAIAAGTSDPKIVHAVNVEATRRLLEAAREARVGRFVFVSTISATRAKRGPYGETKRIGEELVAASGVPFVIVRPSLVYGPGGLGLFATITAYLRSLPVVPVIGSGEIELDPVHVDDVCEVLERSLLEERPVGKTYDLLGPERVTFHQFLELVSREIGVRKPVFHIPGPVAMFMAWGFGLISKKPPITADNVIGMVHPARVDRGPLARDFPLEWIRLGDGLATLLESLDGAPEPPPAEPKTPARGARPDLPVLALLARPAAPSRPLRVAIVGLGKMGVAHSAILSSMPNTRLVGLCDVMPGLAKSVRGMGFAAPYFPKLETLLAEAKPDAVWVCTPPDSHAPLTRICAEAGAAVMVEKPMAHTLEAAREIRDAARGARAPVACGYVLTFAPCFIAAQSALAAGALGRIASVRSSMYLSQVFGPQKGWMADPARSGGGVVANISSHLLFLLRWMFGTPVEARATWKKLHGPVEDELSGTFRTSDGAGIGFETSWSVPGYPLSHVVIEAEGERGRMRVANEVLELDLAAPSGGWPSGHTRLRHAELPQQARFDLNGEFFYQEDAHFLQWVTGGPAPPNTAEAGWDVQCMMEALYRSAAADGAPVEVPR